jgi:hypothetical protein
MQPRFRGAPPAALRLTCASAFYGHLWEMILNIVDPADVLCFVKNEGGATDIVTGDLHPALQEWRREVGLGELFAGGVLG